MRPAEPELAPAEHARAIFRELFERELHVEQDGTATYVPRGTTPDAVRTELLDLVCALVAHGHDVQVLERSRVVWHGVGADAIAVVPGAPGLTTAFDDLELARVHWTRFYGQDRGVPQPSPFAAWVAQRVPASLGTVIELGCGNGRDTAVVAQGRRALGMDYSPTAIERNRAAWAGSRLDFAQVDVSDAESLAAATAGWFDDGPVAVYSRFFVHAISDEAEATLLAFLRESLPTGSVVYLEFRTEQDASTPKVFGEHYRRFVDPDALVARLSAGDHFVLEHAERGHGLAVYKDEDPYVARLVLTKVDPTGAP
ncbi:MAG: class I SAM-dependent methyltransferase [Actinomycetales bacterium]|nr:class I SAM-dependent methyltransferase [Actinomycetales bacterium]